MKGKLKPCPFCGGEVELIDERYDSMYGSYHERNITCHTCGVALQEQTNGLEPLIEAWNRRDGNV